MIGKTSNQYYNRKCCHLSKDCKQSVCGASGLLGTCAYTRCRRTSDSSTTDPKTLQDSEEQYKKSACVEETKTHKHIPLQEGESLAYLDDFHVDLLTRALGNAPQPPPLTFSHLNISSNGAPSTGAKASLHILTSSMKSHLHSSIKHVNTTPLGIPFFSLAVAANNTTNTPTLPLQLLAGVYQLQPETGDASKVDYRISSGYGHSGQRTVTTDTTEILSEGTTQNHNLGGNSYMTDPIVYHPQAYLARGTYSSAGYNAVSHACVTSPTDTTSKTVYNLTNHDPGSGPWAPDNVGVHDVLFTWTNPILLTQMYITLPRTSTSSIWTFSFTVRGDNGFPVWSPAMHQFVASTYDDGKISRRWQVVKVLDSPEGVLVKQLGMRITPSDLTDTIRINYVSFMTGPATNQPTNLNSFAQWSHVPASLPGGVFAVTDTGRGTSTLSVLFKNSVAVSKVLFRPEFVGLPGHYTDMKVQVKPVGLGCDVATRTNTDSSFPAVSTNMNASAASEPVTKLVAYDASKGPWIISQLDIVVTSLTPEMTTFETLDKQFIYLNSDGMRRLITWSSDAIHNTAIPPIVVTTTIDVWKYVKAYNYSQWLTWFSDAEQIDTSMWSTTPYVAANLPQISGIEILGPSYFEFSGKPSARAVKSLYAEETAMDFPTGYPKGDGADAFSCGASQWLILPMGKHHVIMNCYTGSFLMQGFHAHVTTALGDPPILSSHAPKAMDLVYPGSMPVYPTSKGCAAGIFGASLMSKPRGENLAEWIPVLNGTALWSISISSNTSIKAPLFNVKSKNTHPATGADQWLAVYTSAPQSEMLTTQPTPMDFSFWWVTEDVQPSGVQGAYGIPLTIGDSVLTGYRGVQGTVAAPPPAGSPTWAIKQYNEYSIQGIVPPMRSYANMLYAEILAGSLVQNLCLTHLNIVAASSVKQAEALDNMYTFTEGLFMSITSDEHALYYVPSYQFGTDIAPLGFAMELRKSPTTMLTVPAGAGVWGLIPGTSPDGTFWTTTTPTTSTLASSERRAFVKWGRDSQVSKINISIPFVDTTSFPRLSPFTIYCTTIANDGSIKNHTVSRSSPPTTSDVVITLVNEVTKVSSIVITVTVQGVDKIGSGTVRLYNLEVFTGAPIIDPLTGLPELHILPTPRLSPYGTPALGGTPSIYSLTSLVTNHVHSDLRRRLGWAGRAWKVLTRNVFRRSARSVSIVPEGVPEPLPTPEEQPPATEDESEIIGTAQAAATTVNGGDNELEPPPQAPDDATAARLQSQSALNEVMSAIEHSVPSLFLAFTNEDPSNINTAYEMWTGTMGANLPAWETTNAPPSGIRPLEEHGSFQIACLLGFLAIAFYLSQKRAAEIMRLAIMGYETTSPNGIGYDLTANEANNLNTYALLDDDGVTIPAELVPDPNHAQIAPDPTVVFANPNLASVQATYAYHQERAQFWIRIAAYFMSLIGTSLHEAEPTPTAQNAQIVPTNAQVNVAAQTVALAIGTNALLPHATELDGINLATILQYTTTTATGESVLVPPDHLTDDQRNPFGALFTFRRNDNGANYESPMAAFARGILDMLTIRTMVERQRAEGNANVIGFINRFSTGVWGNPMVNEFRPDEALPVWLSSIFRLSYHILAQMINGVTPPMQQTLNAQRKRNRYPRRMGWDRYAAPKKKDFDKTYFLRDAAIKKVGYRGILNHILPLTPNHNQRMHTTIRPLFTDETIRTPLISFMVALFMGTSEAYAGASIGNRELAVRTDFFGNQIDRPWSRRNPYAVNRLQPGGNNRAGMPSGGDWQGDKWGRCQTSKTIKKNKRSELIVEYCSQIPDQPALRPAAPRPIPALTTSCPPPPSYPGNPGTVAILPGPTLPEETDDNEEEKCEEE